MSPHRLIIPLFTLALTAGLQAAETEIVMGPLSHSVEQAVDYWGEAIPHEIPEVEDRKGRKGPKFRINMDVYRPKGAKGPLPVVVLVHGGGLGGGKPDTMKEYAEILTSHGYLCFAPGYTLGKGLTPAVSDIRQAIRAIRSRAKEFDADPDRIALWGFSAGGWIGSCLGLVEDGESISTTEKVDGKKRRVSKPTDTGPLVGTVSSKPNVLILSSGNQTDRYKDHIDAGDPPILAYCGEKEYRKRDERDAAFATAGVHFENHGVPDAKHCPHMDKVFPRNGEEVAVYRAVLDFLAEKGLATASNPAP